jgi:hypothetical protein
METSAWRPDYVVGITRGGLTPANLISQYLDCNMQTLHIRLRDGNAQDCESNLWMPDDAVGSVETPQRQILVVDDINDSGATLNWLRKDWESSCPHSDWRKIWNHNVRFAMLYHNAGSTSSLTIDYVAKHIDKTQDPSWVVFPWEQWWTR